MKKVTIYTAFSNFPQQWLKEAIISMINQTYKNFEFALIFYGNDIIDHEIITLLQENNIPFNLYYTNTDEIKSFIDVIKFILPRTHTDYILRLDADDILVPEALQTMINYTDYNPEAVMIVPNHHVVDSKGIITKYNREGNSMDFPLPTCALLKTKFLKTVEWLPNQIYRDKMNLIYTIEKNDLEVVYNGMPLFYYRVHNKSISHGGVKAEIIEKQELAIKKFYSNTEDRRIPNH